MFGWIDVCVTVFFVAALILEYKRGFGRAVFDLAAFLIALRLTWELNGPVSNALGISADPHANQAAAYVLGFLIIGVALICVGRLVHSATLVTTDVFDPILGCLCGLGIATIASHVLVQAIAYRAGGDAVPAVVAGSVFGTEFLRFGTYHQVLELLYNFHHTPEA